MKVSLFSSGILSGLTLKRDTLLAALVWALIPSIISFTVAVIWIHDQDVKKVVYAGAGTLLFGGFLGGMLKALLDEHVASKRRRDETAGFVTNVLSDLKEVYDRVARAKIVIPAPKSVKTYGDEMRDLIEARVQLRNVTRALERRAAGVDESLRKEVTPRVNQMEAYLGQLTSEFRDKYKPLSDRQRGYEERAKVILDRFAKSEVAGDPPELPGFVWESLSRLEHLSDFVGDGNVYQNSFERPLDDASELLRKELARILGEHPPRPKTRLTRR